MVRAGGFPCVGSAVQVILALELHEQRFLPYIEKVQLLLLRTSILVVAFAVDDADANFSSCCHSCC